MGYGAGNNCSFPRSPRQLSEIRRGPRDSMTPRTRQRDHGAIAMRTPLGLRDRHRTPNRHVQTKYNRVTYVTAVGPQTYTRRLINNRPKNQHPTAGVADENSPGAEQNPQRSPTRACNATTSLPTSGISTLRSRHPRISYPQIEPPTRLAQASRTTIANRGCETTPRASTAALHAYPTRASGADRIKLLQPFLFFFPQWVATAPTKLHLQSPAPRDQDHSTLPIKSSKNARNEAERTPDRSRRRLEHAPRTSPRKHTPAAATQYEANPSHQPVPTRAPDGTRTRAVKTPRHDRR